MRTMEEALIQGKAFLKEKGITEGDLDAWYLLSHYFHIDRARYIMNSRMAITEEQYHQYLALIYKRGRHVPLQYITGEQEFMGLKFLVKEDVLIPRQDTEILVEEALKVSEGKEVLDLCTGSGCIIISLAKLGGTHNAVGVDISKKALILAEENARQLQADVTFLESDMYTQVSGKYDIIISNPPYIPTRDISGLMEEVKNYEPVLALDGSMDGLYFYRVIISGIGQFLKPDGYIFLEIGCSQAEAVSELLREAGIVDIEVIDDLAGLNRVIRGRYKKEEESFT